MSNRFCFLMVSTLIFSCATATPKATAFRTGPGPVGVAFSAPAGFAHTQAWDLNDDVFFGPPGSLQILRVSDLPLPFDAGAVHGFVDGDHIDQATIDAWAARYTRDPDVTLVSARSLFWNRNKRIGALEVIYKDANAKGLQADMRHTAKVAVVITKKGVCTISLLSLMVSGRNDEKTWRDILSGIEVSQDARIAEDDSPKVPPT